MSQVTPEWMNDPLVACIPKRKLAFLEEIYQQGQGKNQKQLNAYFLPLLKKAKEENLTFTPDEMKAAFTAIRKYSSEEENRQIDRLLKNNHLG